MTYSSDLIDNDLARDTSFIAAPAYPSIFGITFSPIVSGLCLAAVGGIISTYLYLSFLQPQIAKNQELYTKLSETQNQIDQRKDNAKKIAIAEQDLARANAQKQVILNLFANDKKIDTLLLDLSKITEIRQGELQRFVPDAPVAGSGSSGAAVVNDGSLGAALNNKLKRKGISIAIDGTFDKVQSILRTIERLDQLLIVKDFRADVDKTTQKIEMNDRGKIMPQSPATLKTTFKLQALIPLTAAEQAAATPPAPPAKK